MNSEFYYITIATKPHLILDNIKRRVESQEESIIVLGQHENRPIGWQSTGNFGIKLKEVQDFVMRNDIKHDDIVLFTDAYDVIYGGSRDEIIRRYLAFDKPIVFGCEKYCNPDPRLESQYTFRDTEFPYLNSGLFIGRVWALCQCMEKYKYNDKHDDQFFWTLQFLNKPDLIGLDYQNSLFLNTAGISIDDIHWDGRSATYRGQNPLFVHINGPDKSDLKLFLPSTK
jgi:hypothetical protein